MGDPTAALLAAGRVDLVVAVVVRTAEVVEEVTSINTNSEDSYIHTPGSRVLE
jgi:hypothetical protein